MAHSEEWAIGYVGGWKKAETGEEATSQWSTPSSGPLAPWEKAETKSKARKAVSQWSTLESGPLAPRNKAETRSKAIKSL